MARSTLTVVETDPDAPGPAPLMRTAIALVAGRLAVELGDVAMVTWLGHLVWGWPGALTFGGAAAFLSFARMRVSRSIREHQVRVRLKRRLDQLEEMAESLDDGPDTAS